jgi:hypothetical protein
VLKINALWPVPSDITAIKLPISVLLVTQGVLNVLEPEMDHALFVKKIPQQLITSWYLEPHLVLIDVQMVSFLILPLSSAFPAIPTAKLVSTMPSSAFHVASQTLESNSSYKPINVSKIVSSTFISKL